MAMHIEIYHDQYGLVDTLPRNDVTFMQIMGLMHTTCNGMAITLEKITVRWPKNYQTQRITDCYVVSYVNPVTGDISNYFAYGDIKSATKRLIAEVAAHIARTA